METRLLCWIVAGSFCLAAVARGGDLARPAEFIVGRTIAQTNPPGFGAEYGHQQRINNWTDNPGMEPLQSYQYWEPTGAGTDATGDYAVCSTRRYDTLGSGFYDGAHYRLYRETTNGVTGRMEIQKIREGVIPAGGFIAAGYEEIGLAAIRANAPATAAVDDWYMTNGVTWYYAVVAYDTKGNASPFSAPVAGVAATNVDNGPRIKTQSIPNPALGTAYTFASPLVRMSALGGATPLTWSVASGALPAGLILTNTGAIFGTCTSSNQAECAIRVTDASGRTNDRPYIVFWEKPAKVDPAPAAPSNVVVEANNGFVYLTWDAPADTDIDYYKVFRSRWPASQHMERIYLGSGGPQAASGDLLFVDKQWTNAPPEETRSVRVIALQSEVGWRIIGSGAKAEIVPHPAAMPPALSNENPGVSCLQLTSSTNIEFGVWLYRYGGTGNFWWSVYQLPTGRTYRMECWVRGEGAISNTVHLYMPYYCNATLTGIVNGAWTKVSTEFAVTNWICANIPVNGPQFLFRGAGTVCVDNAVVYCADEPRGVCHLTQPIYDMWLDYSGPSNRMTKGTLRTRYNDGIFDHAMNPSITSMRAWDFVYGGTAGDRMHIHDALQASYESGATPETRTVPWITANLKWREQDYINLVEYLCGPAGTPYGDLRIAQRGGITTPWIDEFRTMYIEMGNEPWNTTYFFGFRGGIVEASGRTYGRWCTYIWEHVQANSPYYTNKMRVSLGGWAAGLATNKFTGAAREECPLATHVGLTSYLGGWEAGQGGQVGGTEWSDEGVQQWMVFNEYSGGNYINSITAFQNLMASRGLPFEVAMYEGGPSY
ncbi:hypothetical protein GX586_07390, partial [bacterium]|nr:hypothetical protein [bacterium]